MTSPDTGPQASPAPADGAPQAPGKAKQPRKVGDFELLSKIGQGAMGTVFLARQISQDRKVALKILPMELARDQEFLERFRREARTVTKLTHPNIVSAYQIGVSDGYHYIALEYVDGLDLETILDKRGFLPEKEVLRVALEMCSALEAAHAIGVVHRDIKPSNILIDPQGAAKLIDLGLSSGSQGDRRVTIPGFAVGTPYYISPEQARGLTNIDARVDFYGLGATLYHLSTGKLPFPGNNAVVIMTKHIQENPLPPHQQNPAVSKPLSALIQKLMSKNPAQRPQNAQELRSDIEGCMRGELPSLRDVTDEWNAAAAGSGGVSPATVLTTAANRPLDERILEKVDELFSFAPKSWRVPIAAAAATIIVLVFLVLLVSCLRR